MVYKYFWKEQTRNFQCRSCIRLFSRSYCSLRHTHAHNYSYIAPSKVNRTRPLMQKISRASCWRPSYIQVGLSEISSPESRSLIVLAQSVTVRRLVITRDAPVRNRRDYRKLATLFTLFKGREPFPSFFAVLRNSDDIRFGRAMMSKHPLSKWNRREESVVVERERESLGPWRFDRFKRKRNRSRWPLANSSRKKPNVHPPMTGCLLYRYLRKDITISRLGPIDLFTRHSIRSGLRGRNDLRLISNGLLLASPFPFLFFLVLFPSFLSSDSFPFRTSA